MSSDSPAPEDQPRDQSETVRKQHVTARVPEAVSRGVFSTGVILMTGNTEFVIDFLQNLGGPAQVVARIALPHAVLPSVIAALRTNLDNFSQRFGAPPELPRPQNQRRPSVQEIYDELKLPDELLAGSYANGLMVGHSASEFKLDFLDQPVPAFGRFIAGVCLGAATASHHRVDGVDVETVPGSGATATSAAAGESRGTSAASARRSRGRRRVGLAREPRAAGG